MSTYIAGEIAGIAIVLGIITGYLHRILKTLREQSEKPSRETDVYSRDDKADAHPIGFTGNPTSLQEDES